MIVASPYRTVLSSTDPANEILNPVVMFAVRAPDGRRAILDKSDGTSEVANLWLPE